MIEQWMHVRAKIPIDFKFDVKLRVTSEITCILTSLIERFLFLIGQNLLIYNIRR